MSLFKSPFPRLLIALAALSLGACSKTGSPPTEFGVNVTVDATALDASTRAAITTATLTVVKAGMTPVVRTPSDLATAIKTGTARFHYTPAGGGKPDAGVGAGDSLAFTVDVSDGTNLLASGSGSVTLAETAVTLKIELASATADGGPSDGGGRANGVACATDDECGSKFCTDGVCCNERCNDTCVSCNQTGSKGMCKEYAVDTDPEMECAAKIPVAPASIDAGTEADASGSDGGVGPAAADGSASDALVINTPDGGLMTMPNACGGVCSGARACRYPDGTKSCGKPFCNSHRDVISFACNGNGGCEPATSACADYACNDSTGACRTTCAAHLECQLTDYCNGNNQCVQKKTEGLTCATDAECRSGHCAIPTGGASGVCCNTKCDAPFSCNDSGSVGQCKCPGVTCNAGVACQVFYQDADGDGYGNAAGTIVSGTAKAGCAGSPPAGFVADDTDCDDGDANAHPGQTGWFGAPSLGKGLFDYNCDGVKQKETPEYVGGSCKFCNSNVSMCSVTSATCSDTSETASFQCPQEGALLATSTSETLSSSPALSKVTPSKGAAAAPGLGAVESYASITPTPIPGPICRICILQCCGCQPNDKTGFLQTVDCGDATKSVYTCGSCSAVGGGPLISHAVKQQRCH